MQTSRAACYEPAVCLLLVGAAAQACSDVQCNIRRVRALGAGGRDERSVPSYGVAASAPLRAHSGMRTIKLANCGVRARA